MRVPVISVTADPWDTAFMKILLLSTVLLASSLSTMAEKKPITVPGATPSKNFSAAILNDGTLYVSGQTGADKAGKYAEKFEDEVKQCFDNIDAILKAAGFGMKDLVAVQVYLTDMDNFQKMNGVYTSVIPEPRPSRTTVGVAKLVGTARIEIKVPARK